MTDKAREFWISVDDQLPEFDTEVLCFWSECNGGISIGTLDQARYIHTKDGVDCQKDWTVYSSVGKMEYDVTHWMPLPKSPNEAMLELTGNAGQNNEV